MDHLRIILAGLAGGIAMNLTMLLTFRLIGFGWNGGGILLNDELQSSKLIDVWTKIEPIPLVVNEPAPIITGIIVFGIIHAYIFNSISASWPGGVLDRGLRFSIIVFLMVFLFWEFFTPYNMFGEPLVLILLELFFWLLIALADGFSISFIMNYKIKGKKY